MCWIHLSIYHESKCVWKHNQTEFKWVYLTFRELKRESDRAVIMFFFVLLNYNFIFIHLFRWIINLKDARIMSSFDLCTEINPCIWFRCGFFSLLCAHVNRAEALFMFANTCACYLLVFEQLHMLKLYLFSFSPYLVDAHKLSSFILKLFNGMYHTQAHFFF